MSALVKNPVGDSSSSFDLIQNRMESMSCKMDKLINIQEKVLNRLDGMSQDIDGIEKVMENLKVDKNEIHLPPRMVNQTQVMGREVGEICQEMSSIMSVVNQRSEQQAEKLDGMEKKVLSMQQVISFIGETVKSLRVMEMMFKGPGLRKGTKLKDNKGKQTMKKKSFEDANREVDKLKDHKGKDGTNKTSLRPKGLKAQKTMKAPDITERIPLKKEVLLLKEGHNLNQENPEKSGQQLTPGCLDLETKAAPKNQPCDAPASHLMDNHHGDSQMAVVDKQDFSCFGNKEVSGEGVQEKISEKEHDSAVENSVTKKETELFMSEVKKEEGSSVEKFPASLKDEKAMTDMSDDHKDVPPSQKTEQDQMSEVGSTCSKSFLTEEHLVMEDDAKSPLVEEEKYEEDNQDGWAIFRADGVEFQLNLKQCLERERKNNDEEHDVEKEDDNIQQYFIDTAPPPEAPFKHRIVSAKPNQIINFYTINWQEVLGGGRFGQVHKCVENSSGLTLAAKVIKARSLKEKEVVKNEIQVMNNLDHASLIQLYAAYESRNDIILVLEYVGGGELFDRIIDQNYTLMELDAVVFIRQICEGLQHMHKMYILHLDLKPENILCVSRVTNKIKIIDFGLARIYKPQEKLRVNFGTPEFLAPEVINYDFVSFNTDMWSLGIITYMLLSGLCPFLGDDDNETLNNILGCKWSFDEPEFVDTSEEAKDFISRMLIMNKGWRMGATESLRHPWLSDPVLHHRLHTKKTMCRSRRSSCVPTADS
ncbi:myosin light chain kinase 2, skeletal/cardiac muscle [Antennarius striatus]|uniref:myosin light chain kinase 2, skeletal/cardiac muscle n=1 Tax=Antennarius striatus TaxID=241820 RepID=UPI0035AE138A